MANAFGTPERPITTLEVIEQVKTYQAVVTEHERLVKEAQRELSLAQDRCSKMQRRLKAWQDFADALKDLP